VLRGAPSGRTHKVVRRWLARIGLWFKAIATGPAKVDVIPSRPAFPRGRSAATDAIAEIVPQIGN